jgi:hypothetical protein
MTPLLLVGDEREYWRRSAEALVTPAPWLPVLAGLVEPPGPVLRSAPAVPRHAVEVGAELAAVAAGDVERAAALEPRLRAGRGPCPGAWVAGVGPAAALGLARAVAGRRPFLAVEHLGDPRLPALARSARSLLVVAEEVRPDDAVALQRALDEAAGHEVLPGVPACPVGYLHARDRATMTFLDAKQRRSAGPGLDVLVDYALARAPEVTAEGLVVLPYPAVSRDAILERGPIRLLAITTHGMSDLVHLNEDYICGRSRSVALAGPGTDRLPSCMVDGRCFLKPAGTALRADELPAEHLFANSCGSMRFGDGDFGGRFNVWYTALEGRARSFAGSLRLKDGHGLEGLLYRQLLAAGHPLGAAVAILNRAIASNQVEPDDGVFLLLGDPEERLAGGGPTPGWERRTVADPELARALERGQLLVDAGRAFSSAVPVRGGSAFHLLLFGYGGEPAATVRSLEADVARVAEVRQAIEENLGPALGLHRLYPDRVRQGGRKNLENRLLNVARLLRDRFTNPSAVERLAASQRGLFEDVDRTDADVAAWLEAAMRRTRYRLAEQYQDVFQLAADRSESRCPICGDGVTHRTMEHVLRPALRRVERVCRACGSIEDGADPSLSLTVLAADRWAKGASTTVTLRLASAAGRPWHGHCLAAVRRSLTLPVEVAEPVRRVVVPAGATVDVAFDVRLGEDLPVHQYDVQAAFVSATRLFIAKRPFWVA